MVTSFSFCDMLNFDAESKLLLPLAKTVSLSEISIISCRGHGRVFRATIFWRLLMEVVSISVMPRIGYIV